jgi:hypothetical protein
MATRVCGHLFEESRVWRKTGFGDPQAIKDQQLVFGQNGFRDDGSHTAGLKYAHDRSHDMDKEENQITHTRF